ncbi:PD-(D/E)XK nuclease family protein [Streptomyces murinus]|uniref:PD-(D/E)XK nuclease family protein n=1 Tax=Streptomyces murinus TaxID=33900 RepID=UPI002114738E|nr:PD-(D/E)XK nuclease family protein [Streptomyces murinus]
MDTEEFLAGSTKKLGRKTSEDIMAESWPPDGLIGDSGAVHIRLGMFGPERYRCPASDMLKARGLRLRDQAVRKTETLESFTNGPFMASADRIEHPENSSYGYRKRPLHDGLRQWTEHALRMYSSAFPPDADLRPAQSPWVYRYSPPSTVNQGAARHYRISAWGRCFESADGRRRELRLPVNRLRKRNETERAVAALVAAEGNSDPRVEEVRVIQFALSDGQSEPVFEGSRAQALDLYRAHGAPAVRALLDSQEYRPGSACVSCVAAPVCPALPKAKGLLGIADRARPRRSWSSTTSRGHQSCPARGYLRGLRLPPDGTRERNAAAERGRAIHQFLAERHSRRLATPCTAEIPADWVPDGYRLPDDERLLGAELLRHHAEVCPLRVPGTGPEIRVEPRLVFDDTSADLVVMADPDLLYRDGDAWVWRETKTSGRDRGGHEVLATYPQLALAVAIIGAGLLPGSHAGGRVELELLRPGGVDLRTLDPCAPQTRTAAEKILRAQVSSWHSELLFEAVPGPQCTSCEMAKWCSARPSRGDREEVSR